MPVRLSDPTIAAHLFDGWEETLIYSCLDGTMGQIFVTDPLTPRSACASVGCFSFFAGVPCESLVRHKQEGFTIMVGRDQAWNELIERCHKNARRVTRYATRKDTVFDITCLDAFISALPEGFQLSPLNGELYDVVKDAPAFCDFVSAFASKEAYLSLGRGMVILQDGSIVAGASSYTSYRGGIEIEVDTLPQARRQGLATIACAALIKECLENDLYPSWDAQNIVSLHLAQRLGYVFSHEYTAFEVL